MIPEMDRNIAALFIYLFGMALIAFGTAAAIEADIGKSPYDAFIYGLMAHTGKSYAQIRWAVDGFCLLAGIGMGGAWGAGIVKLSTASEIVKSHRAFLPAYAAFIYNAAHSISDASMPIIGILGRLKIFLTERESPGL